VFYAVVDPHSHKNPIMLGGLDIGKVVLPDSIDCVPQIHSECHRLPMKVPLYKGAVKTEMIQFVADCDPKLVQANHLPNEVHLYDAC
jgi:hypothetical protein